MNVLSLFSGIGGLDLGLERAGMTIAGQVEIDPWCRSILARHWPEVPRHDDVRTAAAWWLAADAEGDGRGARWPRRPARRSPDGEGDTPPRLAEAAGGRPAVDLVAGGFPCQPVSLAGKGLAQADSRWLWPAMAGVIRDLGPRFVLVENVPGLLGRGMGDVLGDLAGLGYDAEWDCVPAAFVGAPHIRNRVWVVAYPQRGQLREQSGRRDGSRGPGQAVAGDDGASRPLADAADVLRRPVRRGMAAGEGTGPPETRIWPVRTRNRSARDGGPAACGWWAAEPGVGRVAHGIPARVDRLRGLGNAVVPQVAEHIGRLIMEAAA